MIRMFVSMVLVLCCSLSVLAADIGEKAPSIQVEKWLQGSASEILPGDGKLRVIEFWATWCPPCLETAPHLSGLQERYRAQGLEVVGITNQQEEQVLPFIADMREKMSYRIGIDRDDRTFEAYLDALGVESIPYAFVVGGDGLILWHGHPMAEELEQVVAQVLEGNFSLEAALAQRAKHARTEKAKGLLGVYDYLKLDVGEPELAEAVRHRILEHAKEDPRFLVVFGLLLSGRYQEQEASREAFEAAVSLPEARRAEVFNAYAEVLREAGDAQAAAAMKEKVSRLLSAEPQDEEGLMISLLEYLGAYAELLNLE